VKRGLQDKTGEEAEPHVPDGIVIRRQAYASLRSLQLRPEPARRLVQAVS